MDFQLFFFLIRGDHLKRHEHELEAYIKDEFHCVKYSRIKVSEFSFMCCLVENIDDILSDQLPFIFVAISIFIIKKKVNAVSIAYELT